MSDSWPLSILAQNQSGIYLGGQGPGQSPNGFTTLVFQSGLSAQDLGGGLLGIASTLSSGITQLTGDVTAGPGSGSQVATVVGLQSRAVSSSAPSTGNTLGWTGAAWAPSSLNLAGGVNYVTGTLPAGNLPSLAGDVTGPYGANLVSSISGSSPIVITPSAFQWVSNLTSVTLAYAQAGNGSVPGQFAISPQAPGAGASTTATGTPGNLLVSLANPVSTGVYPYLQVSYGGVAVVDIGSISGFANTYGGLWLGSGPCSAPSTTNYALISSTASTQLNVAGPGSIFFGVANVQQALLTTSSLTLTPSSLVWTAATSAPTIGQLQTSGSSPQNLTLSPQTSSNATVNAASLVVTIQSPAGGGTQGFLQVQQGGTTFAYLGEWTGGSPFGAIYLGNHTPTNTNYALISDANGDTQLNTAGTGTIFFLVANVQQMTLTTSALTLTPATFQWANATTSPTISQLQLAGTGANAGQGMLVQPQQGQQQTGANANNNGGALILNGGIPGTGGGGTAGLYGAVSLGSAITQLTVGPNGLFLASTSVATTGGTLTLTQAQYQNPIIRLTGTLASSLTVVLPNVAGVWFFDISGLTLASFTVTWKSGSGSSSSISAIGIYQLVMVNTTGSNSVIIND